ncbi:MAG: pentapeptide repeat-containing protein, partial [Gammaproteobacteria bacterium]|nr:pentapeptide repeat-containing protein [Gammaproteobacteria bacterium]
DINEVIADSAIHNRNLYIFFGGVCLFFLLAGLSTPEEAFLDLSNNGINIPFAGIHLPYIFFYTTAPLLLLIVQVHLYLNLAKHRQRRKDNSYPELMTPFTFDFADIASAEDEPYKHNDNLSLLFRILNYCVLSILPTLTFLCLLFRITDYQDMTLIIWNTITLALSAIFVVSFIPGWSKLPRNICCIHLYLVVVMGICIIIHDNYSQIVDSDDCDGNNILYAIPGAKIFTPGKISIPSYHKDSNEYSYTNYAGRSFVCADFTNADFKDQTFVGANFNKAQLNRIQLQGADLENAKLQRADLLGAQLQGANLEDVNLLGADLQGAQLQGAKLWRAQLQGADLQHAHLQGTYLLFAEMQGADLSLANLQGAYLDFAQLQGANLWRAQLQGANLVGAQLHGASCKDAPYAEDGLSRIRAAFTLNTRLTKENCSMDFLLHANIKKIMKEISLSTKAIEVSYFTMEKTTIRNKIRQQLISRVDKKANFTYAECGSLTKPMADFLEDNWEQGINFLDWDGFLSSTVKEPCQLLTKQAK